MSYQFNSKNIHLPTLIIPERLLSEIAEEAKAHPHTETGAAMVGVEARDMIIILGIIPAPSDSERRPGLFKSGGDYQVQVYQWYKKHWDMMRKASRRNKSLNWTSQSSLPPGYVPPELDTDLTFLGDWHKQPANMTRPSSGDIAQIREILNDPKQKREQVLSPIVTQSYAPEIVYEVSDHHVDTFFSPKRFKISWYYSRRGHRPAIEITPVIVSNDTIPRLPPIPWFVSNPQRLDNEILFLTINGYETIWHVEDIDHDNLCEGVFAIDANHWNKRVVVTTKPDYPDSHAKVLVVEKPTIEVPKEPEETMETNPEENEFTPQPKSVFLSWILGIFQRKSSGPPYSYVESNEPKVWDQDLYIVDIVKEIEERLIVEPQS